MADRTIVYCKNGLVVATHADSQNIDPVQAYGAGTTAKPHDPDFVYERVGDPPPDGQPDTRPYACPF